jgi:hypothetical protein
MELNALTAISPIDGRYFDKTNTLSEIFSEFGLIKYRVLIEVKKIIRFIKLLYRADENSLFNSY